MCMEPLWNDSGRENLSSFRKSFLSTTLSTKTPTWIPLVSNMGLHSDRHAANRLGNDTTILEINTMFC